MVLNRNENNDPDIQHVIQQAVANVDLFAYPDIEGFRNILSNNLDIPRSWILPTCGCTEAITIAFNNFVGKLSKVQIKSNTYQYALDTCFKSTNNILLYQNNHDVFEWNKYFKPDCLYLCNPNNPTGEYYSLEEIEKILNLAAKTNTIVFIDETYKDFIETDCLNLVKKFSNLILGRSFSKAWGCAGLRVGYLVANESLMKYLENYRLKASVNTAAIAAVTELLQKPEIISKSVTKIKSNFSYFKEYIETNNGKVLSQNNTNFIYFESNEDIFVSKQITARHFFANKWSVTIPSIIPKTLFV